jgi:hypothetical protein
MHFKWTNKELENATIKKLLKTLIIERQSTCTNVYSPLYKKLQEAHQFIEHLPGGDYEDEE